MPLSTSERVTLLKEIADRLGPEDWGPVDLILKQFAQTTSIESGKVRKVHM